EQAKFHLASYNREWVYPAGLVLFAQVHMKQGDRPTAREIFQTMLIKAKGLPSYSYRRNRHSIQQAEKLFKSLK
ncbi:MAG: hypothetical protein MUF49_07275, partial [Oculatellaceae cyanobacterium Prado106]|nr:hypothetical protein [Oculatellaceae cyanobacterium Prado106]